jgi:epoxyqueuosine reductase
MFSDLEAPEDGWREPVMLARCETCAACRRHCPVGAIGTDRFLLRAERCITFHNEKPAGVPFPEFIEPAWHNCVVGCLHCQRVCPENREVWARTEERARFTEEETAWLLDGTPLAALPDATVVKLERSHLSRYAGLLPRNLRALLDA